MGEDVVDASGAAEEAGAGDGGEDCGGRRSAASECNVFSSAGTEVMTKWWRQNLLLRLVLLDRWAGERREDDCDERD